jgi:hypothetical protein
MLTKHLHHQDATCCVDDQESNLTRFGDAAYRQGWKDQPRPANRKAQDRRNMTAADLDAAVRTIAGSARSMEHTVEGVV